MTEAFKRRLEHLKAAIGVTMVGVRELQELVPAEERDAFSIGESQVSLLQRGATGALYGCAEHVQNLIHMMEEGAKTIDYQLQQKETHDASVPEVAEGKDGGSEKDL